MYWIIYAFVCLFILRSGEDTRKINCVNKDMSQVECKNDRVDDSTMKSDIDIHADHDSVDNGNDKAYNVDNTASNSNVEEREREEEITVLKIMEQRFQFILKTLLKLSIAHPQSR